MKQASPQIEGRSPKVASIRAFVATLFLPSRTLDRSGGLPHCSAVGDRGPEIPTCCRPDRYAKQMILEAACRNAVRSGEPDRHSP